MLVGILLLFLLLSLYKQILTENALHPLYNLIFILPHNDVMAGGFIMFAKMNNYQQQINCHNPSPSQKSEFKVKSQKSEDFE